MQGRKLAALLIGVCVLSAAIGSGLMYLAKEGPEGPAGAQGPRGLQGVQGFAASEEEGERAEQDVQDLESRVNDLEVENGNLWEELEYTESEVAELGDQVTRNSQSVGEICAALELICP